MRILVALGGNALLKRGEPMTAEAQRANIHQAALALAPIAEHHQLVLSHGNGPQVGLLALQASAYEDVEPYPLDILDAQTEGMIGYLIEQELGNLVPQEVPFATILTMIKWTATTRHSQTRRSLSGQFTTTPPPPPWPQKRGGYSSATVRSSAVSSPHQRQNASSRYGPFAGCLTTAPL